MEAMPRPRPKEDDAAEDCLIEQEAERQDETQRLQNRAAPRLASVAAGVVRVLRKPDPSPQEMAAAVEDMTRAVLLSIAERGNALRAMVVRQQARRNEVFAKRSTKRLVVQPITRKRIVERKAAIEAEREVEAKGDAPIT